MKYAILKKFITYVSLNVLGMIGLSVYILADTFFVSKSLGANGLAALNFSISLYCLIHGTGLMLGIGGATKYAILKSQNNHKKANLMLAHTIVMGAIASTILVTAGVVFTVPIAKLLGASGTVLPLTCTYLKTILCFSPCFILNNIMLSFIRNDGNPTLSMCAMLLGSFSNIVLDYIFMFPLSMGMFGAALATGLAPVISLSLLSLHVITKKNHVRLIRCGLNVTYCMDIMAFGLSAFITELSSGVVLVIFNLVILQLEGNVGVAAYGIIANLALVLIAIFVGIAQGIQPLVSKGYGAGDIPFLKWIFRYALCLSVCVAIVAYNIVFFLSTDIIAVFNSENNKELISIAANGFRIYFIGFFFAGLNIVTSAFLSATEHAKSAFIISMIRGCIAIVPLVFILSRWFSMNGVWLSFTIAEMIACVVAAMKSWNMFKPIEK